MTESPVPEPPPLLDAPAPPAGCTVRCIAFDFDARRDLVVDVQALTSLPGTYAWIDVEAKDVESTRVWLESWGLIEHGLVQDALTHAATTHMARFDDYLHLVLSACRMDGRHFEADRVDVFIAERFMLTLHSAPVDFLERMRRTYREDFLRFAQSPSFLVYELWDHVGEHYVDVQKHFEDRVEALQAELMGDIDDAVFAQVSLVGSHLLNFRKVVSPARAVLTELSSRRTRFVNEATQRYLANMIGTVDRVLQDALVDRDILNQSLNLHMSIVSHQTNRLMNKLTVVSIIFLPLSFLAGVYGMNFEVLPELKWQNGYTIFWTVAATIVATLLFILRRMRLL